MAAPVKELKRAILAGHFRHGANPALRMCFGNVVAERDAAENEKFTKEKARGRIDGAVAAAMAIGRYLAGDTGASVYTTDARPDGFLFV
jgi:phage terminase large subunit-like protein